MVFCAQVLIQYVNASMEVDEENYFKIWQYVPCLINVSAMYTFGIIYKWAAYKCVLGENHQYESDFENSMINKIFIFLFVNTYISNFIYILYY